MPGSVPSDLCFDLADLNTDGAVRQFEQAGLLQVSNFLAVEKVAALAEAATELFDRAGVPGQSIKVGPGRHMIAMPVAGAFNDTALYAPPELRHFFSRTLGERFLMSCFSCVVAQADAPDQHIHQDRAGLFGSTVDIFSPSFAINLFVPLVPLNSFDGTTRIWPYSHRKPELGTEAHAQDYVLPELNPGSALLLDYRVNHNGTANRSSRNRPLLCLAYSRDWFVDTRHFQTMNPLQIEPATLHAMDPDSRHLFSRSAMYRQLGQQ